MKRETTITTIGKSTTVACVTSVSNRVIARKLERELLFFLLSSQLSRRTREETLDTQATTTVKALACVASVSVRFRSKE